MIKQQNRIKLRFVGCFVLIITALLAVLWGLSFGGGAAPLILGDPGEIVRWGLPISKVVVNLSAAGMIGPLVLALFALPVESKRFNTALGLAAASAAILTIAAAITGFLSFLSIITTTPSLDSLFGEQLGKFLIELPLGQSWLITTIAAAILTILLIIVRGWTATLLVTIAAIASLIPMGTLGHSGEQANHNVAVSSLIIHIIAAAVWIGGLLLIIFLKNAQSKKEQLVLLKRFSTIALVCFFLVAYSGIIRSIIGIGSWEELSSPYGIMTILKAVLLLGLGGFGAWYRLRIIKNYEQSNTRKWFWMLVVWEIALMGLASGLASALGRTPPPTELASSFTRTPAEILTGAPMPPEFTPERWITAWTFDPLWVILATAAVFFYLAGVYRLQKRGDKWPIYRTVLWLLGIALFIWVTTGPIAVYEPVLFSAHMLGHMLLSMAIPMFLVSGAPITLALRAIKKRHDGSRGAREWILWGLQTPFSKVVTNPYFAAGMFIGSLWAFYFTDLFRWSLYDHVGHIWMVAHFLISGYLFVLTLIGIDPIPYRAPYPFRLLVLIAVMAIHAFFGVAIMSQTGLMVADWFGSLGRTWGVSPLEDQNIGGGIAWSVGEIPTLILAITVAIQWNRNDVKEQRRTDRHADRTAEAELEEYNARLEALARRDQKLGQ